MRKTMSSKAIALGGILSALTIVSVFFSNVMPTNKLTFFALSSVFVSIILIEMGVKTAWTFYFATSLLSLILVPDKVMVIPFITFFGVYGIIKYYIEKHTKIVSEYILKLLFFNANVFLAYYLIRALFETQALFNMVPLWALFIILEVIFLVYDYVYTMIIQYYCNKLKKVFKI